MASNQTTNYQLNQWEPTDQVLRTDFNADNAKLDAVLTVLAEDVDEKASQAVLDTLTQTVAGHTALLAQKGNCQIYTTTYTGTGTESRSFTFPQSPLLVIIGGPGIYIVAVRGITEVLSLESSTNSIDAVWSGNSLTFSYAGSYGGGDRRVCNQSGSTYRVVAFLNAVE